MYPLISRWMVDEELTRTHDPDRLARAAEWARAANDAGTARRSRQRRMSGWLRASVTNLARRGSLGPVSPPCPGDRVAQWP
jgi:hypothetical protein